MTVYSDALLVGTGTFAGTIAYTAWRNRRRSGTTALAGLMLSISTWSFIHLFEHHTTGMVNVGLRRLGFIALAPIAFLWFAFVLEYTGGHDRPVRWPLALLFVWPVVVGALVLVPENVGTPLAVWSQIDAERGPVYWGHVSLSYGVLAAGTVLLVSHVGSSVGLFRKQGLTILAGVAAAWGGSVVSVFELAGDLHIHALPLGFILLGGFLTWSVVEQGLTQVTPVARRTIVRTLDAGIVAIDADRHVTSVNPAATELFGLGTSAVGRPVADVFDHRPELLDWLQSFDAASAPSSATFHVGDTVVEGELSPLYDARDRHLGGVFLFYDVTERRRQHERLEQQTERMERFNSVVSHDLRNPLNVAQGHLDLERERRESRSEHLAAVHESLERMKTLIADLRTLTRQGRAIKGTERTTLSTLAERSWRTAETPDAGLTVDDDLAFMADGDRVVQLLENLFRNAIEHGAADASVRVGAIDGEGFYVADDGSGIPEERRERVFEAGYSTATDGTGLGLAIVSTIVEAHGWTVRVTESEAGGARFEITGVASANDADTVPSGPIEGASGED
jgi:PAS domain S-box-containing protein